MAQLEDCKQIEEGRSEDTVSLESEESDLELEYEGQQLRLQGGSIITQSQTPSKMLEIPRMECGPITHREESEAKEGTATKTILGKINLAGMANPENVFPR